MKKNSSLGFTLIELLVVITISFILMTLTFANYNYYQNVAKVKLAAKEIAQSINISRNLAIGGMEKSGTNQKVAVLFLPDSSEIEYHSFGYNSGTVIPGDRSSLFKTEKLPENIFISGSGGMIVFSAIFGTGELYTHDQNLISGKRTLEIQVNYKKSPAPALNRTITYTLQTNTTDY